MGLKPTYGAVDDAGGFQAFSPFISVGPLARSVADARYMHSVLSADGIATAGTRVGTDPLRVAWCANPENRPVDAGVGDVVTSAVDKLAACGHRVSGVELDLGGWEEIFGPIVLAEEGERRGHLLDGPHRLTRYQERSLRAAEQLDPEAVAGARSALVEYRARVDRYFRDYGVIVTPATATATTAFELGRRPTTIAGGIRGRLTGRHPDGRTARGRPPPAVVRGATRSGVERPSRRPAAVPHLTLMSDVTHRIDGSTLLVEVSRPDRANALRCRTIRELEAQLDAAEPPESGATGFPGTGVSGVVITGGSRRFSAGADLAEFTGSLEDLRFDDELERLCRRITHSPLPMVAAVEGACYSAAVDLAWACDAVVVSDEARLALPSTRLGILYNPVSVARLHSRLGSSTVRRLMVLQQELAGGELPPGSAIVVPSGTAVGTAVRFVEAVSADRGAMMASKALLASLDSGAEFDPALWQTMREARLVSPARRVALETRRASITSEERA